MRILKLCKLVVAGWGLLLCSVINAGETVEVDGTTYRNAEMDDVEPTGVRYKTEEGKFVVLPWTQLNETQLKTVKGRFQEGMQNLVLGAYAVIGTVFQLKDGDVIVQISTEEAGAIEGDYRNGAKVLKAGLVMIRNPTSEISRSLDDEVDAVAYFKGEMKFSMGFSLESDIPVLTGHPPEWSLEREWKNLEGKVMKARLVAVKAGKGLFMMNGKQFVYPLDQLAPEARAEAEEIQKKFGEVPYP